MEKAIGAVVIAALVIGIIGGVSPQDWAYWYSIPAGMIAVGLLSAKRAYARWVRGSRVVALVLALLSVLVIFVGSWIALEHYQATPINLGGHSL